MEIGVTGSTRTSCVISSQTASTPTYLMKNFALSNCAKIRRELSRSFLQYFSAYTLNTCTSGCDFGLLAYSIGATTVGTGGDWSPNF